MRLIYADDSGAESTGWVVYGWVECSPAQWRPALRSWLNLRKELYAQHQIPPAQELHATKYVNGRQRISLTAEPGTPWKTLGRAVAISCLTALRDCPHVRVGAAYRYTPHRGKAYYQEKGAAYTDLVRAWDRELAEQGQFGMVAMDGDGTDLSYFTAHRGLPLDTRRVIEDPMFHDSKKSQWTQMADLIAYVAYMTLNPHDGNKFGSEWYREYLAGSDPRGAPFEI